MAQPPLECARCDLPAPILVEHPALYMMAVPYCPLHYVLEAAGLHPIEVSSPEAADYTVLRGYVVPRQRC
jgi:hypothetical protein